jgi:hypothetical protein
MAGPLNLNPSSVRNLSPHEFTLFCNELIRAEAGRLNIPQDSIDTTVREIAPDGGIDASICEAAYPKDWTNGRWLPEGNSGWQFKSGRCPSAQKLSDEEFIKPEVLAVIDRGDTYCFLTADALGKSKRTQISKAVKKKYLERDKLPIEPKIYSGDDLAYWAQEHLAIAVKYFLVPVTGWQSFAQWANAPVFLNEYFADQARNDLHTSIRDDIAQRRRIIHIVGHAGVGKTRAVMEALRPDGLKQRVLYLDDASKLDPSFLGVTLTLMKLSLCVSATQSPYEAS